MDPQSKLRHRLPKPHQIEVIKELGTGSFGKVVLARDPSDGELYACKTERKDAEVPQLELEWKVYRRLLGTPGIPVVYALWENDGRKWMAMQRLGPCFETLLAKVTRWDVVNWIFPKSLRVLEAVHIRELLHRDIKPDNLLTGIEGLKSREVFLVDFGLSKRFRMDETDHIPFRDGKHLTGTARYASLHTHMGEEQSRRDDLESLGYVMVYLIRRKLPWMGAGGQDRKEQHARIMKIKAETSIDDLCDGLPSSFLHYFRHVRSLRFDQPPDYALLQGYLTASEPP